jgi:hypothetical protein
MNDILYPYPTLAGETVLEVRSASLDGTRIALDHVDPDRRVITVRGLSKEPWKVLALEVVASVPAAELLDEEGEFTDPSLHLLLECKSSNLRRVMSLTPPATGTVETTLAIDRSECFGALDLTVVITSEVGGTSHRVIGRCEPWRVLLDDLPRPPVTSALTIRWVDFGDPEAEPAFLRDHAADPYYLHIEDEDPTLFLNGSFQDLRGLLEDRPRRTPAEKAVHDVTRAQIAAVAWQTLFLDALNHVGEEEGEATWPDEGWRCTVLKMFLPAMTGSDDDSGLTELRDRWHDPASAMQVLTMATVAAQEHGRVPKLLRNAIKVLPNDRGEVD